MLYEREDLIDENVTKSIVINKRNLGEDQMDWGYLKGLFYDSFFIFDSINILFPSSSG